ncbi:MAG: glycosyltransferase, partial [Candidatus Electrothrix sp. AR4]|nr:glycosyltransferase [Candidatus Electrothrix sp. AR4]
MSISIIIPVLNEQQDVGVALDRLLVRNDRSKLEIVVVDGGSTDQTLREVVARGVTPISSKPGRGQQQHIGAKASTGDILLFLHCDTALPIDFPKHIQKTTHRKNVALGAFRLSIGGRGAGFRLIEFGVYLRSMVFGWPYGDQALFMRREVYFAAGGFPEQPIMEDVALVARLKKIGRIALSPARVTTSARRWRRHGLIKTTLINQLMLFGRAWGVSPQQLARWYY